MLFQCLDIWDAQGRKGLPPDPYEVYANMSTDRMQVITVAKIRAWLDDSDKRATAGMI